MHDFLFVAFLSFFFYKMAEFAAWLTEASSVTQIQQNYF